MQYPTALPIYLLDRRGNALHATPYIEFWGAKMSTSCQLFSALLVCEWIIAPVPHLSCGVDQ